MPLVSSSAQQNLIEQQTQCLARLFTLTRVDGTVLRFTDHDKALIDWDGNTFSPTDGPTTTAIRTESGLQEQNADLLGVLSDSAISREDVLAGRYNECEITIALVDWRFPWAGGQAIRTTTVWIDRVSFAGDEFQAEVSGVTRFLQRRKGQLFTVSCWKELGSTECGINLSSYTDASCEVDTEEGNHFKFTSSDPTGATGLYDDGYIEWTSGNNDGLKFPVKSWDSSTQEIVLRVPTPLPIQVGDEFTIVGGCNKSASDCDTKYSNLAEHGGWRFLPTTERVVSPK